MVGSDHLVKLIDLRHEDRFLEYKESRPWNDLRLKTAKTAMGMANKRDGGTIIIGVAKRDNLYVPEGMLDEHIKTYNVDDVQAYINRFADPYVRVELHPIEWENKKFLAIVVYEFDEIPVICKLDSGDTMRQGAIYTRSHRIIETSEVRSQTEMREIVEMAAEKGVRHFIRTSERVGRPIQEIAERSDSNAEAFDRQLEDL